MNLIARVSFLIIFRSLQADFRWLCHNSHLILILKWWLLISFLNWLLLIIRFFNSILLVVWLWGINWLYFLNADLLWISWSWDHPYVIYNFLWWILDGLGESSDFWLHLILWDCELWRGRQWLYFLNLLSDHLFDFFLCEHLRLLNNLWYFWLKLGDLLLNHLLNLSLSQRQRLFLNLLGLFLTTQNYILDFINFLLDHLLNLFFGQLVNLKIELGGI
jgi:hypothetical protein